MPYRPVMEPNRESRSTLLTSILPMRMAGRTAKPSIITRSDESCRYSTEGSTINVPADQPTIQAGIDASAVGDIVLVQPGIYFENIDFNGRIVYVASLFLTTGDTSYISSTVIDGSSSGSTVRFASGEGSHSVINGFTIQNGNSGAGGVIFCENSNPTITNNIIAGGAAIVGGGIYCGNSSNPLISNNIIRDNIAH